MPFGLATQITLLRIAIAPVLLGLIVWGGIDPPWPWIAAALLAVASATDWLDGYIARRNDSVSAIGAMLDLVADKILVAVVLVALVEVRLLPAWWAAIVLSREIVVTSLRAQAAARGVDIPAGRWGKMKTAVTMVALVVLLVEQGFISQILLWLALVLTVYSGAEYCVSGVRNMRDNARPPVSGANPTPRKGVHVQ